MSKTRQISMRVTMAGLLALVLLASLFLATGAQAAPAMPEPLPFVQADGTTVMVQARGDEFFNWQECEQGYIIQHNHDTGRWYYAISITSDGTAIAGNEPVGDVSQNDAVGIEGFSFNQGSRMTSQDSLFQAVGNRVAEETYELIAVGTEYFLPIANDSAYALAAGMDAFSAATAPVHANPFPNSIVTRKYQPLLLMLLEWENVRFNDAEYAADFPYVGTSQASRLHDFWSSRTFGSTEFLNGPDIAGHNASLIDSHLEGITLNEWMIEASGNQNLFVRPDNMGADGRWGGRGSVDYFLPEVNEAIRTQGYFRAERDLLISLGVNNMHYLHIEHGIVSVRFAMGHINYNIVNQGGQNHQIIFATYGFNAVRHFINWDNVPKHWNPVVNQYDVFAQDLNFYIIYGGYEGALGGNAARPSFWAHASGLTRVNNIVRGPVYNAETGEQLCRGIGPTLGRATNPIRLVSVRYNPATGVRARHVYGSHGEQQATGVAQGLGVFIHELGHSVWDLPDKAVGGGLTSEELCIGFWCGMGRGTWGAFRYNNYNERLGSAGTHFRVTFAYQMGWLTPMTLDANDSWAGYVGHWSDPRTVRHWDPAIHSIANGDLPMAVKITSTNAVRELFPNAPEARNHEQFFMVENFQHVGFDRSASHEVWNRGIMVWHLDSRMAPQQHNNSHRRFNLEKVMIPNQGVRGNQIHSGWFSDPFWHPGEVFGPCPIPGHALRGWCYADCSVQFCDEGIHHIPISNFHAPQGQPVPDGFPGGGHLGSGNFHGFTATTGNNLNNPNWHAGATHPENFPQIIPTGVTMRVVGPTGGGRTGASPTRENPNHFDPWIVAPRIWVEFGPQATSSATATITPVAPVADIDFGAVRFGYAPAQVPAPQTFRVTNNSTSPTGPLTINLLSYGPGRGPGYAMDIRAFTLGATDSRVALTNQILHGNRAHLNATSGATIANLNPGEYVDLTVAPLHGLNVADWFNIDRYGRGGLAISQQGIGGFHGAVIAPHRAAVQVVGRDGILDSFDVSFLVEPLGRPTFSALNPALHDNIVNANTVQFHTGENWAGARTHDAVPLLIPNATGMPTNWVQITGTHLCSSRPTFTQTFGVGPVSQYTRTFQMSVPVRCATCVPGSPPCGQYVTFDPLPRGLGIFEDTHWFAG
ncbi:MAG: hypothetical protein FWB75_07470, partial [Oscillospiraceae bacterium]|nr:hypothetical protein [Oscillospiraceae bacterium]